jgi:predicted acylesterase/phospholipase RssA
MTVGSRQRRIAGMTKPTAISLSAAVQGLPPSDVNRPVRSLETDLWLVLSGSGAKYPAYFGAVRRFITKYGRRFSRFCGCSGGALAAALMATGKDIQECIEIAKAINPSEYLDSNIFTPAVIVWPFNNEGLYDGDKLLGVLRKVFKGLKMADLQHELHVVTYNIQRKQTMIWGNRPINHPNAVYAPDMEVALLVRASISLPLIFNMVKIKYNRLIGGKVVEDYHIDGGVGGNFPIDIFGDSSRVVGLRFKQQSQDVATPINNKIDLISSVVDAFIDSTMKEHIEDALHAKQVHIDTKFNGLDFNLTPSAFNGLMQDGERCVDQWMKENADDAR